MLNESASRNGEEVCVARIDELGNSRFSASGGSEAFGKRGILAVSVALTSLGASEVRPCAWTTDKLKQAVRSRIALENFRWPEAKPVETLVDSTDVNFAFDFELSIAFTFGPSSFPPLVT